MADPYKVLQVDPEAEAEVVEAAYRRLACKYHPDVNASPDAAERMKAINAAYQLLRDPVRRREHDKQRRGREQGAGWGRGERWPPPSTGRRDPEPPYEQPDTDDAGWDEYELGCWWHGQLARADVCVECHAGLCEWCASLFNPPRCVRCARRTGTGAWKRLVPVIVYATVAGGFAGLSVKVLANGSPYWYLFLLGGALVGVGLTGYIDFSLWALGPPAKHENPGVLLLSLVVLGIGLLLFPLTGIAGLAMAIVRGTRSVRDARAARQTGAVAETHLRGTS